MRTRLPQGPKPAKCGDPWEPQHVRYARLWREVVGGQQAAVARASAGAISERMLQNYGEPQSGYPTPLERAAWLLCLLRGAGVQGWERLLGALCDEMGGRFEPTVDEAATGSPEVRDMGLMAREFAEMLDAYGECADGDGTTTADLERFERELHDMEKRSASGPPQGAGGSRPAPGNPRPASGREVTTTEQEVMPRPNAATAASVTPGGCRPRAFADPKTKAAR